MKPHYISHEKKQAGKQWSSKRDARDSNCVLKGQGKKKFRPKGGEKVCNMNTLLEGVGAVVFFQLFWE